MKKLRKWSRILHRDIGFFFIGTTLIYAFSGIALNHMHDWNPNYNVEVNSFTTELSFMKGNKDKGKILSLLQEVAPNYNYKKHYYPQENILKIFLNSGSSIVVDINTGEGQSEFLKKRLVFYQSNYLHYNPSKWWMWFSDAFAVALILFAVTSFFMVKGKKGIRGRGGVYTVLGFIVPLAFLWYMLWR